MNPFAYQKALREFILAREPHPSALAALGGGSRWELYRRMVRARFFQTLEHAYEDLRAAVGNEVFRLLGELFFAEAPPQSPICAMCRASFCGSSRRGGVSWPSGMPSRPSPWIWRATSGRSSTPRTRPRRSRRGDPVRDGARTGALARRSPAQSGVPRSTLASGRPAPRPLRRSRSASTATRVRSRSKPSSSPSWPWPFCAVQRGVRSLSPSS